MTSKFTGVSWHRNNKSWQAKITFEKKQYYCGSFFTEEKAAEAYRKKRRELITGKEAILK